MKKYITTLLFALIFTAGNAFTTNLTVSEETDESVAIEWSVDKDHSAVTFAVRHFFTPVNGRFTDYNADIRFDPENPANSSIDVTIPINYINTENSRRDNHLKSEDFFNTEKWPNIRFVSNSIRKVADNQYVANGELTIRDVTRSIELPFELLGVMDHPMMENTVVAGLSASTTIKRTDFGVGVGDWAATMVVGDDVEININLELNANTE